MVDDERLYELLERALVPEPAQPTPERVAAVRLLAEQGVASSPPPEPATPAPRRTRRSHAPGWLAAGASVAAAAVVIAMLVLPTLGGSGRQGRNTTSALRIALMSGNPVAIARADANLVRQEKSIAAPERDDAVAAHVEAIQFLRDHPSPDAAAELPPPGAAADPSPVPTTVAPADNPDPSTPEPVPTTVAALPEAVDGPPDVAIGAVVARLNGTFAVEFSVTGFTPDASGAPGSRAVRFSFDDGQAPVTWDGPSPWSFPLTDGVTYHQVCVHVVDANGVDDASTGGCRDIV